jgi:hypothetical protein
MSPFSSPFLSFLLCAQELLHLIVAGQIRRLVALQVCSVDIGPTLDEETNDGQVAILRRTVKRGPAVHNTRARKISPALHQQLHDFQVPAVRRAHQSGVAVGIPNLDVGPTRQQQLHYREVAIHGSEEQRRLAVHFLLVVDALCALALLQEELDDAQVPVARGKEQSRGGVAVLGLDIRTTLQKELDDRGTAQTGAPYEGRATVVVRGLCTKRAKEM